MTTEFMTIDWTQFYRDECKAHIERRGELAGQVGELRAWVRHIKEAIARGDIDNAKWCIEQVEKVGKC